MGWQINREIKAAEDEPRRLMATSNRGETIGLGSSMQRCSKDDRRERLLFRTLSE